MTGRQKVSKKKVILVVSEDPEEQQAISELLTRQQYTVDVVDEKGQAINKILQGPPHLLILAAPTSAARMKSFCAIKEEADQRSVLTILICTREDLKKVSAKMKLEVDECLFRPFSREELLARVKSALRISELQEQLRELARSLRHDRRRVLMDLEMARRAEMRLLPRTLPDLPEFTFAAYYEPSVKVGGDLYDILNLNRTGLAVLVADAAGQGVPAALLIALTKMSFRSYSEVTRSPRLIMECTSQLLGEVARPEDFVTAFLAVIDKHSLVMRYVNASHPAPLLIRKGKLEELETGGFLLGLNGEGSSYEERELQLEPGDKLLLYTNGVVDVLNQAGEFYRKERLKEQVARLADKGIADIVQGIKQDLNGFSQGVTKRDDLTLLGLEVLTAAAERYRLVLPSDPSRLEAAIHEISELASRHHFEHGLLFKVRLGVVEALRNAIEHGSKYKPDKKIVLEMTIDRETVDVTVTDEGDGFDYNNLPDPTKPENLMLERGRGIFLIKVSMDEVRWNRKGNQIRMVKYR